MTMKRQDLLKAAKTLGVAIENTMTADDLRAAINAKLGVPTDFQQDDDAKQPETTERQDRVTDSMAAVVNQAGPDAIATATGPVLAESNSIPNLTPNGRWEGKRAKVIRTRTGHMDMGGAIYRWNGWPTIIPINEEVDVAWPIYEIMKNTIGTNVSVRQKIDPDKPARVENIIERSQYQKYPFSFLGVTPGTEHLPESPWEYTLDVYVEDFPGFTVRMWRQMCVMWEMSDRECGVEAGMNPDEEITVRRNAIHYKLNLPMTEDRELRARVRNQKRAEIGMTAKAA